VGSVLVFYWMGWLLLHVPPFCRAGCLFVLLLLILGCRAPNQTVPRHGTAEEEFGEIAEDVFKGMDKGIILGPDEIKGRNTWNLWCAGTEVFWDRMSRESCGLVDLLKTIDSRKRPQRFREFGLINKQGLGTADSPDKYGLWIDEIVTPEPGSLDPTVYGRPTGIVGFRLFDNPDFQGEAAKRWDAARYFSDAEYASQKELVRPYRVGVAC